MTFVGAAFALVWLAASAVWGVMLFMGGVMANDAGRVDASRHATLLAVALCGALLVALAGVAGGFAFASPGHRALAAWSFVALAVVGLAMQGGAFWAFGASVR